MIGSDVIVHNFMHVVDVGWFTVLHEARYERILCAALFWILQTVVWDTAKMSSLYR